MLSAVLPRASLLFTSLPKHCRPTSQKHRRATPWLIVSGHRPLYISSTGNNEPDGDQPVAAALREDLEQLFIDTEVDLVSALFLFCLCMHACMCVFVPCACVTGACVPTQGSAAALCVPRNPRRPCMHCIFILSLCSYHPHRSWPATTTATNARAPL